ncbi:helix-turn-helix domain-containing protein [Billgrantia endophytica]|uniref:helix-turn-helix domain-containing protein n=1 Tax=Billgrantia endophytica TaxID=2033802 RepID=UPI003BEECDB2
MELDETSGLVEVHVECDASTGLCCPQCGRLAPRYDKRRRQWRHLDTCQFQTKVVADVPRVRCPEHGCLTIQVPWAEGNSLYTALFEAFVIRWLKDASIQAVSRQLKLSWTAIDGIMRHAVKRGLETRTHWMCAFCPWMRPRSARAMKPYLKAMSPLLGVKGYLGR